MRSKRFYSSSQTWPFGCQICHFASRQFSNQLEDGEAALVFFPCKNGSDSLTSHDSSRLVTVWEGRSWKHESDMETCGFLFGLVLWFSSLSTLFVNDAKSGLNLFVSPSQFTVYTHPLLTAKTKGMAWACPCIVENCLLGPNQCRKRNKETTFTSKTGIRKKRNIIYIYIYHLW